MAQERDKKTEKTKFTNANVASLLGRPGPAGPGPAGLGRFVQLKVRQHGDSGASVRLTGRRGGADAAL
jgi:hypothetical protein